MDSLSPESRALYEILMADTAEIYESKFAAYGIDRLNAVKQFANDTRMRMKEIQTTIVSVPGKEEIEVDSVKAALGEDLAAVKSAPSPEISAPAPATVVPAAATTRSTASLHATSSVVSTTTPVAADSAVTKDDLSPGARRIYDLLVGGSVAPDSSMSRRPPSSVIPTGDHEPAAATSTPSSALDVSLTHSTGVAISTKDFDEPVDSSVLDANPVAVGTGSICTCSVTPSTCSTYGHNQQPADDDFVAVSPTSRSEPVSSTAFPQDSTSLPKALHGQQLGTLASSKCSTACYSVHIVGAAAQMPQQVFDRLLRPPWPPPELEIIDYHLNEVARRWPRTVGMIVLHPLGKLVSYSGPITDNETSSSCVKLCLDVVLWKLPRWWSYTQCVRPANAILDVSSWQWVISRYDEVHSQFLDPLLPVNCQFASVYCGLSRRAQMNEESNCGTSLEFVSYCGYHDLNIFQTRPWIFIIVGYFLQHGLQADMDLMLTYWLPVPCLQLFPRLLGTQQGYIGSSSSAFLDILIGGAEKQQHSTCTRVLLVAVCQGWDFYHILQSRLASLKCWFQYCPAQCDSVYSCEKFQWTIAWSLGYHSSLSSIQSRPIGGITFLVQQNSLAVSEELLFRFLMALLRSGRVIQCGLEPIQWRIAWSLSLVYLTRTQHFPHGLLDLTLIEWKDLWAILWGNSSEFFCLHTNILVASVCNRGNSWFPEGV